MRVDLFDFDLPEDRIALRPANPRDSARLLVVDPQAPAPSRLRDHTVADLPELLRPGDALVFNDTRVIAAALAGLRSRAGRTDAARVTATLVTRQDDRTWRAFARPGKRLAVGDRIAFTPPADAAAHAKPADVTATVADKAADGSVMLRFERTGADLDAAIAAVGTMPLPPYIALRRPAEARDRADYQTLFAARDGAVAAPTAGLHFTPRLMQRLASRGIATHLVTLHVGPGTFLPVKVADTRDHTMHAEWGEVSATTAQALGAVRARGGRIVAVGSTSLRVLESAARATGEVAPFCGETAIFITPGYRFRAVDGLITNFHLPRSTLIMMVAAFCGLETIQEAYAHAIAKGYRFYSYGDASLLWPAPLVTVAEAARS